MHLAPIDLVIMAAFFVASIGIGLAVSRKSGKDFSSFFLGSRAMPWWLLGVSMVATTFSTDTPNLVADIVRGSGVVGNWTWWAFLLTGMLTVFLYARLWRRSGVLTDVEFYELRYSGKTAAFLRGFRAAYLGVVFNVFIMASVTLAAIKIASVMLGWQPETTVFFAAAITLVYSALGGLRGVVFADLIQFAMAMVGSIAAAVYILGLPEVGGLSNVLSHPNVASLKGFLPDFASVSIKDLVPVFIVPIAVQWWASYYPGAEPGGGGYIAQRMFAAPDEKQALGATLLFNALHYSLRPWPWIIVALASLVVFPDLASLAERFPDSSAVIGNDLAYPAMLTFLPPGLLGLVITSLAAAYMSTMSTQVNYGSSIIVNDLYLRFFKPEASDHEQVWAGRVCTVLLMVLACWLALHLDSAKDVFDLILRIGAGSGLIYILRWFWWRINAPTELAAMIISFVVAGAMQMDRFDGFSSSTKLLIVVAVTTVGWIITALMTRPTSEERLISFYKKVRPGGPGWNRVRSKLAEEGLETVDDGSDLPAAILGVVLGAVTIYSILFSTGFLLYGRTIPGVGFAVVAVGALIGIRQIWPRLSFR